MLLFGISRDMQLSVSLYSPFKSRNKETEETLVLNDFLNMLTFVIIPKKSTAKRLSLIF